MIRSYLLEGLFVGSVVVFCALSAGCAYLAARMGGDVLELEHHLKQLEERRMRDEGVAL